MGAVIWRGALAVAGPCWSWAGKAAPDEGAHLSEAGGVMAGGLEGELVGLAATAWKGHVNVGKDEVARIQRCRRRT